MSFHLYQITQLYSNPDGSVQYIELSVGNVNGESFWAGHAITVTQGGTTHQFTFPSNLPSTSTANTTVLIATQGFANLGIVTPDFIVPSGFLFTNGGTVNYAGVDSVTYGQLPSDGLHALNRTGAVVTATPVDFAGASGTLTPPVNHAPTGDVTIAGTPAKGQLLVAHTDTLADQDGLGALSYQWLRGGTPIALATSSSYSLTQADVGSTVSVRVSYTDGGGTPEQVTSSATGVVSFVDSAPTGAVTIASTSTQGQLLSANTSTLSDADGLGTLNYQWLSGNVAISGANASVYTPTQADVGASLSVRVTYVDGGGTTETVTSNSTSAVINVNDPPTGGAIIDGIATQGQALSVETTIADADGVGALNYQWLRAGNPIDGANTDGYTLTQGDVGAAISVRVTYVDGGGTTETVTSDATSAVANINDPPTGGVGIAGTASRGNLLGADTAGLADADGLGSFSYQWLRQGADIPGAIGSTYLLTLDDVGTTISVRVSYTDGGGTPENVVSASSAVVTSTNHAPTGAIAVSGTTTEGQTLTADTAALADADGLGALSYQWLRAGNPITGANSSSYTLAFADVHQPISVRVSYTDGGATVESLLSDATAPITGLDTTPPTVGITDDTPGTATGPVTYSLAFSETVTGLAANDFSVTNASVTSVSGSGSSYSVVVTPTAGVEGTESLSLLDSAVTDLAGNPNAATAAQAQPIDTLPPTVLTFNPGDESLGVAVASNIVVNFSEPIAMGAGNIVLKTGGGTTVASYGSGSANLSISGSQLTINPSADLGYGTVYQVQFAPGSVQDLSGNAYAGTSAYNFLTTVLNPADPNSAYYDTVQKMYIGYFGRPADPDGLAYWENSLATGHAPTLTDPFFVSYNTNAAARFMIDFYGTSPESSRLYAGASVEDRVTAIYQNVLDRGPDAGGLAYWSAQIRAGTLTFPLLGIRIVSVAEVDPSGLDSSTIAQKLAEATVFTQALDTPAEVTAYSGDTATAIARAMLNQVNGSTSTAAFAPTVQATIDQLLAAHGASPGEIDQVPDVSLIGVADFGVA